MSDMSDKKMSVVRKVVRSFSRKESKIAGDKIGVDWNKIDSEQFHKGMMIELEHGKHDPQTNITNDDPSMTGKIALIHLKEIPDYYTRLEKMEKEGGK